ncbi:MAG: hypothetical protein MT490_06780 [Sphingomonas sp.]|uniref:hypothetical protein n=1 Tax=Sphingomonas sp. TaxID=28214 RepID=UPI00227470A3|nr:hypothetical protein [Sphingomonas sp.]MCX8475487.1 hypothetical protein [Sphingomonas sp.]
MSTQEADMTNVLARPRVARAVTLLVLALPVALVASIGFPAVADLWVTILAWMQ